MKKFVMIVSLLIFADFVLSLPTAEDFRYLDRDYTNPAGAHQLASWLASQLRPKADYVPVVAADIPVSPYRLPLQTGKRNSEVTNAIIGSEETQKMYREGRK